MFPSNGATAASSQCNSRSPAWAPEDAQMLIEWKKQLTAYVAWMNSQLKKKPGAHLVEDLRHDIRDGVALINLIEVIAGETLPGVHLAPSTHEEMRENVDKVLHFMFVQKIKMHHITIRDIVEGNLKATMRLILALAAHYKPNSVRHSTQCHRQSITGIAQGAAAALTEARRNASRAGHRHKRRRHRDESTSYSDRRVPGEGGGSLAESRAGLEGRAELEGASANNSPTSSHNTSPRTSLYLSDPPSSMEGLLSAACAVRKGVMVTSCESDNAMGDSGYFEICDTLKETHQMLFKLHDLILNGEATGDTEDLPEDLIEGANLKETVCILKGRLLHAETVAESLRSDLNKVKKDCLELQATKAGLQQRLKDQDVNISGLRSAVMKLELEQETLLLEIEALKKHQNEREQVFSDVKNELLNREFIINQLQQDKHYVQEPHGTTKINEVKREAIDFTNSSRSKPREDEELGSLEQRIFSLTEILRWMENSKMSSRLQAADIEAFKGNIQQGWCRSSAPHQSSSTVDRLEDAIVLLLDKLHVNGSEVAKPIIGQHPSNEHLRQHCGNQVVRDVSRSIQAKNSLSSCSTGSYSSARSNVRSPYMDQDKSPGTSSVTHTVARTPACSATQAQQQPWTPQGGRTKMQNSTSRNETSVLYYIGESDTHFTCVIQKKLGEVRLRDFKSQIADSYQYHYFFKSLDPEYGTVKEELSKDDDILPGWEGKIVAWLEVDHGAIS
ncbi:hypothetical protein BsWGS_16850 [Bradybaena similaris]